ncbi:DUF1203 domain-containing protein [Paracoccus denitrificans]|uniref:DUF1203 domain-containing protein n=1 Tax=Paracoccus denitrificans TaxID=266 RepID=UPI000CECC7B7|nr:DUF1203 domain-containing protein [Paracoccus denitrificans]
MAKIKFLPLPSDKVDELRNGGRDAYDCAPERVRSSGSRNPCRHCLDFVPRDAEMLILAYRPFDHVQPYAETGPIFLCADECAAWAGAGVPPILTSSPDYLLKGYTAEQRIRYGTGRVVAKEDVAAYAAELLDRDDISFVDVRSARNNCFQVRIVRSA